MAGTEILAIIGGLEKGSKILSNLKDFFQKKPDDESVQELRNQLIDLIESHYQARITIIELDKSLRELQEQLENSEIMKFDGKFYYIDGEEYPYCPGCWGAKKRKTHLVIDDCKSHTEYKCPTPDCKFEHHVDNPNWNPPRYVEDSDDSDY